MVNVGLRRLFGAVIVLLPVQAWAEVVVHDWSLTTAVQDLSIPTQDTDFSTTVQNPLQLAQLASLYSGGTATTVYDFSWAGDTASFNVTASQVVPDLGSALYRSFSMGSMNFSVSDDVRAHFTGQYSYSLPVPGMETIFGLSITDYQPPHTILGDSGQDATITTPSASGTFALDRTWVLQAGHTYFLQYTIYISASGNSGALATGNGFLQLRLEPIPEPATIALIGLTAILRCRRR